jgi:hyperosmotically inducible protein
MFFEVINGTAAVFMNKLGLRILVLLAATALAGCTALVIGGAGAAAGGYYVAKDKRSLQVITDDAGITYAINAKFLKDDLVSPIDVNVDTYEGVVTLRGMVDNPAAARRAYDLAYSVDGVTRVISNLNIRSQAMTPWGPVDR